MQSPCFGEFTVDPEVHRENRRCTEEKVEYGGSLLIDFPHRLLLRGSLSHGEYNRLQILERGVVDWHSHPAPCLNKNTCTEGIPSPWDLANHIIGALYGSAAHLVYAAEGTYLIQVRASVLRWLKEASTADQRTYVQSVKKTFLDLDREFKRSRVSYKSYIETWLLTARKLGLNARLFRGDRNPTIKIYYDCHLPDEYQGKPYRMPINIPKSRERYINGD